jgi:tetratricopeptide (TPR) repeat protein
VVNILKTSRLVLLFLVICMPVVCQAQQRLDAASEKRAQLMIGKGDFAGAIAIYEDAIKLNPNAAAAYLKRGVAFRLQGELDKAIEDFDKATIIDPKSTLNDRAVADAYLNHGQIQLNNLRPEDGMVDFEKALRIYPAGTRPYFDRGEARILLEDFAGAIEDFDTFLKKDKPGGFSKALAVGDRSLAKHHLGRDDEARKDLESIKDLLGEWKDAMVHHTTDLEARLLILRHIRSQEKKAVA